MTPILQKLNNRHQKMIELCLAGYTNGQLAEVFGMTDSRISLILKTPIFQHELALRREKQNQVTDVTTATVLARAKDLLDVNSFKAAKVQSELLESESDTIRRGAANDILNRVLGAPKVDVQPIQINIDQLNVLQTALAESDRNFKQAVENMKDEYVEPVAE